MICQACGGSYRSRHGASSRFCSRACYLVEHTARVTWACKGCGIVLSAPKAWVGKRKRMYCSYTCKVADSRPPASTCRQCGVLFTAIQFRKAGNRHYIIGRRNTTCSDACLRAFFQTDSSRKAKIGAANRGSQSQWWKGGVTALNQHAHRGTGWLAVAEQVRERDGRRCRHCGMEEKDNGRKLDVHHVQPFHNFSTAREANRLANLISLCRKCHRTAECECTTVQLTLSLSEHRSARRSFETRDNRGSKHPQAKLTEVAVSTIRRSTARTRDLARDFNVSEQTVSSIRHGRTWKHVA